jgi:hypothetical protein
MWLFFVLCCFVGCLILFSLICRLPVPGNTVFKFVGAGATSGLALVLLVVAKYGLSIEFIAAISLYSVLCELYIFLFTFVGSSVSISLLLALWKQKRMSDMEIQRLYVSDSPVAERLQKLESVGLLKKTESGHILTKKGLRFVRTFRALRLFFRHDIA